MERFVLSGLLTRFCKTNPQSEGAVGSGKHAVSTDVGAFYRMRHQVIGFIRHADARRLTLGEFDRPGGGGFGSRERRRFSL